MRKLISHMFTQDMTTWKHAANEYTSCVPHSTRYNTNARSRKKHELHATQQNTRGQECAVPSELETAHSHNDRKWSASVRTPSRDRNSRHECWDPNTTLQHETRHADERAHGSSTLEAACSHETRTWRECQGSVTKPWITLDRSDRTLTEICLISWIIVKGKQWKNTKLLIHFFDWYFDYLYRNNIFNVIAKSSCIQNLRAKRHWLHYYVIYNASWE